MALIIGKLKCCFCNSSVGFFHSVETRGRDSEINGRIFYHDECLKIAEKEYRSYKDKKLIQQVLRIHNLKENSIMSNKAIVENHSSRIERISSISLKRLK